MKCRKIDAETGNIVWFGVKDANHTKVGDSYAESSEGVASSLRQRLSVLKHELWYDYDNGMPLLDKVRNKSIIDAYVIEVVLTHPDVIDIKSFDSEQNSHSYTCKMIVNTKYGQVNIEL